MHLKTRPKSPTCFKISIWLMVGFPLLCTNSQKNKLHRIKRKKHFISSPYIPCVTIGHTLCLWRDPFHYTVLREWVSKLPLNLHPSAKTFHRKLKHNFETLLTQYFLSKLFSLAWPIAVSFSLMAVFVRKTLCLK